MSRGEEVGDIGAIKELLTPSFRNPPPAPKKKNGLFSHEMHLKILLLCCGLKMSNTKPGCRVSALYFFVK
jgi:hypothetical protein